MDTFNSGAWRKATRGEIYIGGAWRSFTRAEAYINDAWRTVLSFAKPFSVSAPPSLTGARTTQKPTAGTAVTPPATATPTGGTAPYSYLWQIISGSAGIATPNNASTTFSAYLPAYGSSEAVARVTCTDARGLTATASVQLSFFNEVLE